MATLERILITWTGLTGLPGVSVCYGVLGGSAAADLGTMFTSLAGQFPSGLTVTIPNNGDTIDDATGALTGTWSAGSVVTMVASGTSTHAAGVGCYINWKTSAIVGGRRLMGRTFLAPLTNTLYDSQGTINSASLGPITTAANLVVAGGDLRVWHRPVGGSGGSSAAPVAAAVPDQVTSLRSRRR